MNFIDVIENFFKKINRKRNWWFFLGKKSKKARENSNHSINFFCLIFSSKATRQIVDTWLVSHATPTPSLNSADPASPTFLHAQHSVPGATGNSSSRGNSGATTPVRKISAHEFEKGGLLKPIVNTIDGTPTFLSVGSPVEGQSVGVQSNIGFSSHLSGRPQRRSRHELRNLDEKELIFELVREDKKPGFFYFSI